MNLKNILDGIEGLKAKGELDLEIEGIESNSKTPEETVAGERGKMNTFFCIIVVSLAFFWLYVSCFQWGFLHILSGF